MTEDVLTWEPDWLEEDRLHEACGVFGIINHPDAAALTAFCTISHFTPNGGLARQ